MGDTITVKGIMEFFGMKASDFMKDWKKMTPKDKEDIKKGLTDGTYNY